MIEILLTIAILGVILYLVEAYIAMPPYMLTLFRVVAVIFIIYYLLKLLPIDLPSL